MVMARVAVPVPPALVAPIVTLENPVTVGAPVISPVAVSTAKPLGRPVAENENGDPLAAIWYMKLEPAVATALIHAVRSFWATVLAEDQR